jgi:hypothetical protein
MVWRVCDPRFFRDLSDKAFHEVMEVLGRSVGFRIFQDKSKAADLPSKLSMLLERRKDFFKPPE